MELIFLGTGTSQGVPMIAQDAPWLDLKDKRNWRTRTSVHLVMGGRHIQIDAGPDFRAQCLANDIRWLDHFFLTHPHADHMMGMDDLRRFCTLRGSSAMDVHLPRESVSRVAKAFGYAIREVPENPYYPAFRLKPLAPKTEFDFGTVRYIPMPHGREVVAGLVFTERDTGIRVAYYTDCNVLTDEALAAAKGCDILVLDALQPTKHPSHMTIQEACDAALRVSAGQTWLTHMNSWVNHADWDNRLPPSIALAWDGLRVEP